MNSVRSYADFYSEEYTFSQEHRSAGSLRMLRVPNRTAGSFLEPEVAGVSLQISRKPRAGVARFDLGAGAFSGEMQKPFFVVAPPLQACSYDLPTHVELLILEFPVSAFAEHISEGRDLGRLHACGWRDEIVVGMAEHLWHASADGLTVLEAQYLTAALSTVLVRASDTVGVQNHRSSGGLAPWQVRRVTDFLEDHLADDVSLDDLSALVGLSTFHLCRAFKHSTGLPPHRWRLHRRIERARDMLEATDLPVTEVAAAVGYDDPSQLAAAFRKALGISPSQYRRERR